MELIRIKDDETFKMICPGCSGAGVYKGKYERGDLANVCWNCNGKGYQIKSGKDGVFYRNLKTNEILMSVNNEIFGKNIEFNGLVYLEGIGHVVYESTLDADQEYLFEQGYDILHVLPYGVFYRKHVLPLPIKDQNCPRRLEETYDDNPSFNNDCPDGKKSDCPRFKCKECWDKYYTKAKTYNKAQKKLKSMNGNSSK